MFPLCLSQYHLRLRASNGLPPMVPQSSVLLVKNLFESLIFTSQTTEGGSLKKQRSPGHFLHRFYRCCHPESNHRDGRHRAGISAFASRRPPPKVRNRVSTTMDGWLRQRMQPQVLLSERGRWTEVRQPEQVAPATLNNSCYMTRHPQYLPETQQHDVALHDTGNLTLLIIILEAFSTLNATTFF